MQVHVARELKVLVAGKKNAPATAPLLLVKKVTLTAANLPAKPTPTSPSILPFFVTTTTTSTTAKPPPSPSSRSAPLPIPSTRTHSASATSTPVRWTRASPQRTAGTNDDGAAAVNCHSPAASTSTADTLPLAGLASPAAASPASAFNNIAHFPSPPSHPNLARPSGSGKRHDERHAASTFDELYPCSNQLEDNPSPAQVARVSLEPPLRLSAVLKGLMSGELSAQEVRRARESNRVWPYQTSRSLATAAPPSLTHHPHYAVYTSGCVCQVHAALDIHAGVAATDSVAGASAMGAQQPS